MDYLPIFMKLVDAPCLLVGGGAVAARKAELLLRAGARITVVAPRIGEELERRRAAGEVICRVREFAASDLEGCALVVAATDRPLVNRFVSEHARARRLPVNVADAPELCSFVLPAIVDRSPLLVAVSSGGRAPLLARALRVRLESLIPAAYGHLAAFAGAHRQAVKRRFASLLERRRFWEDALEGPIGEAVLRGDEAQAEHALNAALGAGAPTGGAVWLVGAGPGDPDLLTFRALRLMQRADVVLYDRLVAAPVLDLVRREAERVYVGKSRSRHALDQQEITDLMVRLARAGKRVLRLKGGDPFVFGRGGEEIAGLAAQGIPFEVVPGITAASGCAAYAGIPLTHRDHAQACVFVTGHGRDGPPQVDWSALARPRQTLVFYMGLRNLALIAAELCRHGLAPETPAAVIEQGTTAGQRVIAATLADLSERVRAAEVRSPALIIVGDVVRLRESLTWFAPPAATALQPLRATG